MAIQEIRPQNRREFMNKLIEPYDPKSGNPNQIFSEPYKAGQPENNRALEISRKNDTDKDFTVGIKDINEAVSYYFTEVLKLSVVQNNTNVKVPVIYGTSENWKSIQADGYYRDGTSKLMAPLLMFKRTNITQNRNLGNKLDGNVVKNLQFFEKTYSKRNEYSNFSVLNNRSPEKEYIVSITPDYVTIEYSCMIWTNFMEQMDKLIESLNYASKSYWGDPNKFQFYVSIDSFDDSTSFSVGEDRLIRSSFNMTLNGWLIPEIMKRDLSAVNKVYGASQIIFGLEVAADDESFAKNKRSEPVAKLANIIAADTQNVIINKNETGGTMIDPATLVYLNTNKQLTSNTYVNTQTARFGAGWLTAPTGLPETSIDNFTFFCNGQLIEKTAILSFEQNVASTISTLIVDTDELGYSLSATDEIVAIGKFI
jgi:hypothetical protein